MLICVSVPRMLLLASSYFIEVLLGLEPWEHGSTGCVGVLTRVQGQLWLSWALLTASPAQGTDVWHTGGESQSTVKCCSVQHWRKKVRNRHSQTHPPLLEIATNKAFRAASELILCEWSILM